MPLLIAVDIYGHLIPQTHLDEAIRLDGGYPEKIEGPQLVEIAGLNVFMVLEGRAQQASMISGVFESMVSFSDLKRVFIRSLAHNRIYAKRP